MSSSRSQEDTYEAQNDQRLDELHSKIRTLRGVSCEVVSYPIVFPYHLGACRLPMTSTMMQNVRI